MAKKTKQGKSQVSVQRTSISFLVPVELTSQLEERAQRHITAEVPKAIILGALEVHLAHVVFDL